MTATTVSEGVFAVDEGDEVHLAVSDYEWANPYEVVDVDEVEWVRATDGTWTTREVIIEGGYSSEYSVAAAEGDEDLELLHEDGDVRGTLERFEPVGQPSASEDETGASTEDDTSTSDVDSESEAEESDVLEEDTVDDAPADGDDSESLFEVKRELRTLNRSQVRHLLEERDLLDELAIQSGSPKQATEAIGDPFDDDEPVEHPDWLARDADEIVEGSPIECTLAKLLEIVSGAESAIHARHQIDSDRPRKVRDLLWGLGLRNANGTLKDEPELSDRIETIQEVYVDE